MYFEPRCWATGQRGFYFALCFYFRAIRIAIGLLLVPRSPADRQDGFRSALSERYAVGQDSFTGSVYWDMRHNNSRRGATDYSVAVGTAIADRPPHRSVRAVLPHTAPA